MYFEAHNVIKYDGEDVVDIFRKSVVPLGLTDETLFESYTVLDRESPETIAYELYGSSEYHWVILTINNIVNINKDWMLSVQDFGKHVTDNYSEPDAAHHYEDSDGDVVDYSTDTPVSNYTYEERINNIKANIKILKPRYLAQFVESFKVNLKG